MSDDVTLGEIHRLLLEVRENQKEMRLDIKTQNGRVTTNERNIAVLQVKHDEVRSDLKSVGSKYGSMWGGFIGGIVTAVIWIAKMMFGDGR